MTTLTPRLSLVKPLVSEAMSIYDRQASDNYLIVDGAIGVKSVTSFPGSPFTGQIVYRTDQSKAYFWNGSSWVEWGGVAGAQGLINGDAAITSPSTSNANPGTEVSAISLSFSAVQNRRYLIVACANFEWQDNFEGFFRTTLRWKVGASVPGIGDTLIRENRHYVDSVGVFSKPAAVMEEFNYTAISQTISLALLFRPDTFDQLNLGQSFQGGITPQTALSIYDYGAS